MRQLSFADKQLSTKLDRIEARSIKDPMAVFNNLGHAIDLDLLRTCFNSLDGNKAVGMDRITKKQYAENLEANLEKLLTRIRNGSYLPKPSRIIEIPKPDGSTRPLAISCIEDKIIQEAVRRTLERIFEPHFLDCSYGFRPGRNAHQALASLDRRLLKESCRMAVDIDLKKYFNTIPHKPLGRILQKKVRDKRFLYLIIKLLKAPTLNEDGSITGNEVGSPQGSILSPLLANIYLHYVLDKWFERLNQEQIRGTGHMVRYADDVIFTFESKQGAMTFYAALLRQLEAFGLSVNPEKTRIIDCGSKVAAWYASRGRRMESFSFLGFTHVWGRSLNRKRNETFWRMKRRTDSERMRKKLKLIKENLLKNRHRKRLIQYAIRIVKGYLNYFAVNDNLVQIRKFLMRVRRLIFKALNRRSQRRSFNWAQFQKILDLKKYPKAAIYVNLFFVSKSYKST